MGPSDLLAGQVAIITGGAGGIGSETARVFVRHGAEVVLVDVQPAVKVEGLLKELGPRAHYEQCDVTEEEQVARVWDRAFSLENRLDIVFNNAGIEGPVGLLDELSMRDFDDCLRVNLRGMVLGTKHGARLMKPAGKGSIVCTSSVAGVVAGLGTFTYSVSKAAVIALVQNAAGELAPHGIRVNAISPGPVSTPMVVSTLSKLWGRQVTEDDAKLAIEKSSRLPAKVLELLDVANAVLYLASDLGGFVSGHNLLLDAGEATSRPLIIQQAKKIAQ